MLVVIQSSLTLREAMTKEGRCSVVIGNGPLFLGVSLAMEFQTIAQLIELQKGRGVVTDATMADCLMCEIDVCSLEHF